MTETCQNDRCSLPATHTPVLDIPAVGGGFEPGTTMQLCTGAKTCRHHAKQWFAKDPLPAESKRTIVEAMAALGKAPPDFKRARAKAVRLDSPEAAEAEKIANGSTVH